jgi:cytoskeletal protein RodZ
VDKIEKITEIQEENNPTKPLGELLKSYRENANMDYDQAANMLCLKADTLKALENEQFDLLPESPYIRGYLRSYAKLGNVSSSEAIARYEALIGSTSTAENLQYNFAPTSSVNNVITPIISPVILRVSALTAAILALAVISMLPEVREWSTGVWNEFSEKNVVAQSSSDTSNQAAEDTVTQAEKQTETQTPIVNNVSGNANAEIAKTPNMHGAINRQGQDGVNDTNTQNPKNTFIATATTIAPNTVSEDEASSEKQATSTESSDKNPPSATTSTTPSVASTVENTQTPSHTRANNAANATESNATQTAAIAANTSNPNNTAANNVNTDTAQTATVNADVTQVANAAENPETSTDAEVTEAEGSDVETEKQAGEVSIKLVFNKKVWMRVNSKKKKVFSGLKQNGDVEEFTASKPLSFKVGNAPGVQIYIDGKLYDQTAHTRGAVSRFKIEETP